MKSFCKFFSGLLISSFVLFAISCANPNTTPASSNPAKNRRAQIVNVTFDPNGGGQISKNVYDYALGSTPDQMPVVRRAGYRFQGWNTKANGTGETFNKDYNLVDSIKVYAQWQPYTTRFEINLIYSKAEEDGVTFSNGNTMSSKAEVAMDETSLTINEYPSINEGAFRDFLGFYDANGVKVAGSGGALLSNTPYTDSNNKWIYDYDFYEVESLDLYPRWGVSIKATSVSVDSASYNVELGQNIVITGHYLPADATTTIEVNDFPFDEINSKIPSLGGSYPYTFAEYVSSECKDGTFKLVYKTSNISTSPCSFTFKCVHNGASASCTVAVSFPSNPSSVQTINEILHHGALDNTIGTGPSSDPLDYVYDWFDEDNPFHLYKVYLQTGKRYYFQPAGYYSQNINGITEWADFDVYLYDTAGNVKTVMDEWGDTFTAFYSRTVYYDCTSSGWYYLNMKYYADSGCRGYAGVHVYIDCITSLSVSSNRIDNGTIYLKPHENDVVFNVTYSPTSPDDIILGASIGNSSLVALNTDNLAGDEYFMLSSTAAGTTNLTVSDSYSGMSVFYPVEVITDGEIESEYISNSTSTDIDDYKRFSINYGLDRNLWYSIPLTKGHRYAFETGATYNAIRSEIEDYEDVSISIYDSTFNLIQKDISAYPCQNNGIYYLKISSATVGNNAIHVYDMGQILTSISAPDATNPIVVDVGDISSGFQLDLSPAGVNGDFELVCDNFGFASISFENSTDNTLNDTQPDTFYITGVVPGTTTAVIRDKLSGLEIPINIKVSGSSTNNLSMPATYKAPNSCSSSDFTTVSLSSTNKYSIYSVSMTRGIKYHFQLLDSTYKWGFNGSYADANFYLEDSDNNILVTDDTVTGIKTYTCTNTGTYYFVISRKDEDSQGTAGVRFYGEPITSLDDFETPLTIPANMTERQITIPYSPDDAYYRFTSPTYSATLTDNRGLVSMDNTRNVLMLGGGMPCKGTVTVTDSYSSQSKTYTVTVTPVESDIPALSFNNTAPTSTTDLSSVSTTELNIADLSTNKYKIWSMDLVEGVTYHFLLLDSTRTLNRTESFSNCYFYIEKNDYSQVLSVDNTSSDYTPFRDFTCTETGTYYFIICLKSILGTGNTTAGAVYAYYDEITEIDPSDTLTNINLGLLSTKTIEIPFEPAAAVYDFTVDLSTTTNIDFYQALLSYEIQGKNLVITSLGDVNSNAFYRTLFGNIPLTITDTISDTQKQITVKIVPDSSILVDVDSASSDDINDYSIAEITYDDPYVIYKIHMVTGMTYYFENVDSRIQSASLSDRIDCYFSLFKADNLLNPILSLDDENGDYKCTASDDYYYVIAPYFPGSEGYGAFHVWAEATPATP